VIIKSRSRKEATFGQLIEYINAPGQKGKHAVFYNLKNRSRSKITEEFLQNYQHGPKRKNGNALYHEMISFSAKDSAHFDKDNPHVHLIISANLIRSKKKLRLSQFEFKQIKKQLEIYQKKIIRSCLIRLFLKIKNLANLSGQSKNQNKSAVEKLNERDPQIKKIMSLR